MVLYGGPKSDNNGVLWLLLSRGNLIQFVSDVVVNTTDVIFNDLSKAFDNINHLILVKKLIWV